MRRLIFTFQALIHKRRELRFFLNDPTLSCETVLDITPALLQARQIDILVLDFDGVLAPHNGATLLPQVFTWLQNLEKNWPFALFIFSNKPSAKREAYFKQHFPKIGFIKNVARKPYPEGLIQLQKDHQIAGKHILMVDDRLLTGILAALLAGTEGLFIRNPYQNFKAHPIKEAGFHLLRRMDRLLLQ